MKTVFFVLIALLAFGCHPATAWKSRATLAVIPTDSSSLKKEQFEEIIRLIQSNECREMVLGTDLLADSGMSMTDLKVETVGDQICITVSGGSKDAALKAADRYARAAVELANKNASAEDSMPRLLFAESASVIASN